MLEQPLLTREQLAIANAHDNDARIFAIARVADHVPVAAFDFHHDSGFFHLLEMTQRITHARPAVSKSSASDASRMRVTHASHDLTRAPVEKRDDLVDHARYAACVLPPDARRLAALDEIVEARPFRSLRAEAS